MLIDDAQWLDRASVQSLAFVARRLMADPVALMFAVREPSDDELTGLPELKLQGLGERDARPGPGISDSWTLDVQVRDRIVAETRGNPLALLQLPRGLTPAELAGGFGLPDTAAAGEPRSNRVSIDNSNRFRTTRNGCCSLLPLSPSAT